MRVSHDVEEIPSKKRFSACYAEVYFFRAEIFLDLVEDTFIFVRGELVRLRFIAVTSAVEAVLVTRGGKFEKETSQFGVCVQIIGIVRKLLQMARFQCFYRIRKADECV